MTLSQLSSHVVHSSSNSSVRLYSDLFEFDLLACSVKYECNLSSFDEFGNPANVSYSSAVT
jgi:hypothetical protein